MERRLCICRIVYAFAAACLPCRYSDMTPRFGRSKSEIYLIVNTVLRCICTQFEHILSSFQQKWLHLDNLTEYTVAVHNKRHALDNCWGFIDGTVRPICRPGENQRVVYHGHKRVHALRYQSIINSSLCEDIAFSEILTMLRFFEIKIPGFKKLVLLSTRFG